MVKRMHERVRRLLLKSIISWFASVSSEVIFFRFVVMLRSGPTAIMEAGLDDIMEIISAQNVDICL